MVDDDPVRRVPAKTTTSGRVPLTVVHVVPGCPRDQRVPGRPAPSVHCNASVLKYLGTLAMSALSRVCTSDDSAFAVRQRLLAGDHLCADGFQDCVRGQREVHPPLYRHRRGEPRKERYPKLRVTR